MKTLITETFRRVVASIPDLKYKKALEDDIKRLLSLPNFKSDFKDVKIEIKPSVKDDVLVIDCIGDGADSVSRKLKDLATKHKAVVKIKNEKPMSGVKEGEDKELVLPKVGDTIKHKLTGAEFVLNYVSSKMIKGKITKLGTLKGVKLGQENATNPRLIGINYEIVKESDNIQEDVSPSRVKYAKGDNVIIVKDPYKGKKAKITTTYYDKHGGESEGKNKFELYIPELKKTVSWFAPTDIRKDMNEGKAMPNIISSVLNKLQDDLGSEVANPLWKEKAPEITDIINSVRGMTGTSTGQKVQAAVDQIKKLQSLNENVGNKTYAIYELSLGQPANFWNEEEGKFIYGDPKQATLYTKEEAEAKMKELLAPKIEKYQSTGKNYQELHIGDLIKKGILPKENMNENKKPKLDLRKMIFEAMEIVKAEAKEKSEETPETEEETGEEAKGELKPKAKKLEKDEIGKFYIVTRPTKADDNIVHETNVLDLITKIKNGEIDPSRVLGAFKKRGGANALAKVHLKQISAELDELKSHMEEFRNSKKTLETSKAKAKSTILKYKPASPDQENLTT